MKRDKNVFKIQLCRHPEKMIQIANKNHF